jgi:hypothetical protein
MTLNKRISGIEKVLGVLSDGPCQCPYSGPGSILWPDGKEVNHGPCPWCGKARPVIHVIYDGS